MLPSLVLVTRPAENSAETNQTFIKNGFQVFCEPLLNISYVPIAELLNENAHIITTSSYAIRALAKITPNRHFSIWCVGAQSAQTAHELGFKTIHAAPNEENAKSLMNTIACSVSKTEPLIYLRGLTVAVDMGTLLAQIGYKISPHIVYESAPTLELSKECLALFHNKQIGALTLYSKETVNAFVTLVEKHQLKPFLGHITALCLSDSINTLLQEKCPMLSLTGASTQELIHLLKLTLQYSQYDSAQ